MSDNLNLKKSELKKEENSSLLVDILYNIITFNFKNKQIRAICIVIFQLSIFVITKSYVIYFISCLLFLLLDKFHIISEFKNTALSFLGKSDNSDTSLFSKLTTKNILKTIKLGSEFCLDYTDTILVSAILGHNASILFANYDTIISRMSDIFDSVYEIIFDNIKHIFEFLNIKSQKTKSYLYITASIIMYLIIGRILYDFLNHFMAHWVGHKYILRRKVIFIIIINFCLTGLLFSVRKTKRSLGLIKRKQYNPIFILIFNLIASGILGMELGIVGIIIGSLTSKVIMNLFLELIGLFKILSVYSTKNRLLVKSSLSLSFSLSNI